MHRRLLPLLLVLAGPSLPLGWALPQEAAPDTSNELGFHDDVTVERILEIAREDNRVEEHLRYLTQRIGPRLTGSSHLQRACEWAAKQFEDLGLEARLEPWGTFPVGFDRHPWSGGMVAPEERPYTFITRAWTAGTPGAVRGRALPYPADLGAVEALGASLRDAWIVRLPRVDMPPLSERREIEDRMHALGIAGLVRNGGELLVTSGDHDVDWDDLPDRVTIRLLESQWDDLRTRLAEGEEVELEFDVDNRFLPGPIQLYNVVADLVGSEAPDEYVIVSGHIDSWDGAEGAQDNGTGVSTTLEAARILVAAGARPRRTIRFILWTGEEQGLLGSRAYVAAHPELMPKISAVLVHDGGTNYLSGIAGPRPMVDELRLAFEPLVHLDPGMPFTVEEVPGIPSSGSSDHAPFLEAGVPGFFWRQSGETSYRHVHHTQHDVFENARQDYQRHSATVVAVGAYNLARLPGLLDRRDLAPPPPRRMGVFLDGTTVTGVASGGLAERADWRQGDVVLAVDGEAVSSRRELVDRIQAGGPAKMVRLRRGEEELETVLDWTGEPGEAIRAERRRRAEDAGEAPGDG